MRHCDQVVSIKVFDIRKNKQTNIALRMCDRLNVNKLRLAPEGEGKV